MAMHSPPRVQHVQSSNSAHWLLHGGKLFYVIGLAALVMLCLAAPRVMQDQSYMVSHVAVHYADPPAPLREGMAAGDQFREAKIGTGGLVGKPRMSTTTTTEKTTTTKR